MKKNPSQVMCNRCQTILDYKEALEVGNSGLYLCTNCAIDKKILWKIHNELENLKMKRKIIRSFKNMFRTIYEKIRASCKLYEKEARAKRIAMDKAIKDELNSNARF